MTSLPQTLARKLPFWRLPETGHRFADDVSLRGDINSQAQTPANAMNALDGAADEGGQFGQVGGVDQFGQAGLGVPRAHAASAWGASAG